MSGIYARFFQQKARRQMVTVMTKERNRSLNGIEWSHDVACPQAPSREVGSAMTVMSDEAVRGMQSRDSEQAFFM